jgi:hypothetical protein
MWTRRGFILDSAAGMLGTMRSARSQPGAGGHPAWKMPRISARSLRNADEHHGNSSPRLARSVPRLPRSPGLAPRLHPQCRNSYQKCRTSNDRAALTRGIWRIELGALRHPRGVARAGRQQALRTRNRSDDVQKKGAPAAIGTERHTTSTWERHDGI